MPLDSLSQDHHAAGKNLIGVFHQPCAVLVDLDFLETLPRREYVAGLTESIKHAIVRDAPFFDWHERNADEIAAGEPRLLEELIARNCEIKAEIVARDERETDLRMILNYGHTIGHAIEHLLEYELRHGECIALGMIAENELACRRGILPRPLAERVARLIERLELPTRLPRALDPDDVVATCEMDKKVRGDAVNYVLVRALGEPVRLADISRDEIAAALQVVQPN